MKNLFAAIVYMSLAIVAFVVVVGGIVCITDSDYDFNEYVVDLTEIYKVLVAAVLAAVGHALVEGSLAVGPKDK